MADATGNAGSGEIGLEMAERGGALVAVVEIRNAARANALNSRLMDDFVETLARIAEGPARAVVLTGAGKAFVGGADINEMAGLQSPEAARAFITRVHRCCEAVRTLPVPVIGRINGAALGAGLELAAACDVRVAAETAVLGMPEVRLGIPSVVEAALLPRLVGWGRAREMLLFGETFPAADALAWGLVERVVAADQLDAAVDAWLSQLARCGPEAVRLQKALIRGWEDQTVSAGVAAGIDCFEEAYRGDEPRAAMADFLAARARRS